MNNKYDYIGVRLNHNRLENYYKQFIGFNPTDGDTFNK